MSVLSISFSVWSRVLTLACLDPPWRRGRGSGRFVSWPPYRVLIYPIHLLNTSRISPTQACIPAFSNSTILNDKFYRWVVSKTWIIAPNPGILVRKSSKNLNWNNCKLLLLLFSPYTPHKCRTVILQIYSVYTFTQVCNIACKLGYKRAKNVALG